MAVVVLGTTQILATLVMIHGYMTMGRGVAVIVGTREGEAMLVIGNTSTNRAEATEGRWTESTQQSGTEIR
jgi:hypothetical protein